MLYSKDGETFQELTPVPVAAEEYCVAGIDSDRQGPLTYFSLRLGFFRPWNFTIEVKKSRFDSNCSGFVQVD